MLTVLQTMHSTGTLRKLSIPSTTCLVIASLTFLNHDNPTYRLFLLVSLWYKYMIKRSMCIWVCQLVLDFIQPDKLQKDHTKPARSIRLCTPITSHCIMATPPMIVMESSYLLLYTCIMVNDYCKYMYCLYTNFYTTIFSYSWYS